ncbi:MAG: BT_3928 family protein [Bacteroidota bacterium]
MKVIAQISRLLVGALFIFSGFIKANDPLGFSYKLDEYFVVFGIPWMSSVTLLMAIGICAFEIGLGVALLLGAKMNFTSWSLLLMIVFFTFLTFWSWKFDVVKDCGCFGDFMHLEPFQSFMKDVILLVLILFIFLKRHEIGPLVGERFSTVLAYMGFLVSLLFSLHCYYHLPVIDFRPYAVGKSIPEGMKLPPGAKTDSVAMVFIYSKDGKNVELTTEQLSTIDESYKFVDRIDKKIREGDKAPIHDFTISDTNGTDITEDVLSMDKAFLLVAYDINASDKGVQGKINDFVSLCQRDGIEFIGMTSSLKDDVAKFTTSNGSKFDYYFTDGTTLKTMIRSNPGLILLRKGTVKAMWHWYDFPSFDEVKKSGLLD